MIQELGGIASEMLPFLSHKRLILNAMFSNINQITWIFGFLDYTGITHENIVQEANKFWNATASLQGAQVKPVFCFFSFL